MFVKRQAVAFIAMCGVLLPGIAHAYVGPGAGLGAIGTILALIGAVLLGILGFVWYPVKRMLAKRRNRTSGADNTSK